MEALADRSLGQLLDQVAAKTPSPGGGSSSGMVCALAAGLVQMTAAFARSRAEDDQRPAEVHARAEQLRAQALSLAERDLGAYGAVLDALRLPEDLPGRAEQVDAALSDATDTPLAIARTAGEIAALAAEMAHTSNVHCTATPSPPACSRTARAVRRCSSSRSIWRVVRTIRGSTRRASSRGARGWRRSRPRATCRVARPWGKLAPWPRRPHAASAPAS